jgi:biopolymer transport protein ExbD
MRRTESPQIELQIAPLIDVCFLLLFFYILTSKPVKPESDLGMALPGTVEQSGPFEIPDETRIAILPTGAVLMNDQPVDVAETRTLPSLIQALSRLKQSADACRTAAQVLIDANDAASHQRIVDVLASCAKAGIHQVSLAAPESDSP